MKQAFHGAAIRMAAHNHLAYLQCRYRILDYRGYASQHLAISGSQVPNISTNENLTRTRLRQEFRIDARVRAREEKRVRFLTFPNDPFVDRRARDSSCARLEHLRCEGVQAASVVSRK